MMSYNYVSKDYRSCTFLLLVYTIQKGSVKKSLSLVDFIVTNRGIKKIGGGDKAYIGSDRAFRAMAHAPLGH